MKTRPMQVTAWDGTALLADHDRPGPTRIHRFGEQLGGLVSVEEQLLVPADMDPHSQWLVDAVTGEIANRYAAEHAMKGIRPNSAASVSYAGADPNPACHRWEVWSDGGVLLDLVHTPVDDWSPDGLVDELRHAGWTVVDSLEDLFTGPAPQPTARSATRVRPGPVAGLLIRTSAQGPRYQPVSGNRIIAATHYCRTMGTRALRIVCELKATAPGTPQRDRAHAALVGVVDRHATKSLYMDHPLVCTCDEHDQHRDQATGHHPCCSAQAPALVRLAAMRTHARLIGGPR